MTIRMTSELVFRLDAMVDQRHVPSRMWVWRFAARVWQKQQMHRVEIVFPKKPKRRKNGKKPTNLEAKVEVPAEFRGVYDAATAFIESFNRIGERE